MDVQYIMYMLSTENFVNYCTIHKIGINYDIVDNNKVGVNFVFNFSKILYCKN